MTGSPRSRPNPPSCDSAPEVSGSTRANHVKALYSSSTAPDVAEGFQHILPDEKPVSITIEGYSGVNVGPISRYAAEAEILFQRDTVFDVVPKVVDDDDDGVVRIVPREVAS